MIKAQQELLSSTSKTIVYLGCFAAGKSTAVALKALDSELSVVYNISHTLIRRESVQAFSTIADDYTHNRTTNEITTDTSRTFLKSYSNHNQILGMERFKITFLLDNYTDTLDPNQELTRQIQCRAPKQIIYFANPIDVKIDSYIYNLMQDKETHVINSSLEDNAFIPRDYIDNVRYNFPNISRNNLKGFL